MLIFLIFILVWVMIISGTFGTVIPTIVGKYGTVIPTIVGKYGIVIPTIVGKYGTVIPTIVGKYGIVISTNIGKYVDFFDFYTGLCHDNKRYLRDRDPNYRR